MKGKVLYAKIPIFIQIDKNGQVCDFLEYNKKAEQKVGKRIYPEILSEFRGQPLYTAWTKLIERFNYEEEKNCE